MLEPRSAPGLRPKPFFRSFPGGEVIGELGGMRHCLCPLLILPNVISPENNDVLFSHTQSSPAPHFPASSALCPERRACLGQDET